MSRISKEEVSKVAQLAKLKLNEEQIDNHAIQIEKILDYINQLEKIDTTNVPCTTRAIEVINNQRKIEEERIINRFEGDPLVQVLNGRYGPFIQIGEGSRKTKQNVRIPKDIDPKKLTRQMCLDLRDKSKK